MIEQISQQHEHSSYRNLEHASRHDRRRHRRCVVVAILCSIVTVIVIQGTSSLLRRVLPKPWARWARHEPARACRHLSAPRGREVQVIPAMNKKLTGCSATTDPSCPFTSICQAFVPCNDLHTGMAFRVPTPNVSVVDLTVRLEKPAKYEDCIRLFSIHSLAWFGDR